MTRIVTIFTGLSVVLASFAFALVVPALATNNVANWDTTGDYVVNMMYQGSNNNHNVTLTQDNQGNLTGNGNHQAGAANYLWTINNGSVTGNAIAFTANYTATPDAVTPQTTIVVEGIIAADGSMSGTWSDNYQAGNRSGTWTTQSGTATAKYTNTGSAADTNNDGFIDTVEGQPFYGAIAVSLTESGDTSPNSGLALDRFPVADSNGKYLYTRTITVSDEVRDSLTNGAIVIHGEDINNSGAYDGAKPSSIDATIPFEATVPVACGSIDQKQNGTFKTVNLKQMNSTGVHGTATLTVNGNQVTVQTNVKGASANLPHAQHIHIGGTGECPPNTVGVAGVGLNASSTVKVTIDKFINGSMATASSANSSSFPMTATFNSDNMSSNGGSYSLSNSNTIPYRAVTNDMTKGADYATSEILNGNVVGASCSENKPFALNGYTTGSTKAAAMAATPTTTAPSFSNLQSDMFVIVWNTDCNTTPGNTEGNINGDVVTGNGVLEVTSIEMIKTTAIANGTFTDGWEYVFHITVPVSEPEIAMKFSNWLRTNGTGTIPVANNMRISSLQADNNGASVLLTAANVYSIPALRMTDDLDSTKAGLQVEITVEVAVPNGTPNGNYTTSYGVQSNP